jgi:hypothetical protein
MVEQADAFGSGLNPPKLATALTEIARSSMAKRSFGCQTGTE